MMRTVHLSRIFFPNSLSRVLVFLPLFLVSVASYGQFAFSDQASNYGGVWANGNNQGTGYNAWAITTGGANAGTFIGNPADGGSGTAGIGTTAFALFGHSGQFVNAARFFGAGGTNVPMQIGDVFSFHWAMNFDCGTSGAKGFNLRAGTTTIFNVNNSNSSTISTTNGNANTTYGTDAMLVTLTRTSWTQYSFSMTSRNGGATFNTTINSTADINNINIYVGAQQDNNGNRNIFFNNFNFTKAEPYETNFDLTDPRTMAGASNLTKTGNGNLTLNAANTFTGNTIVNQNFLIVGNDNRFGAAPGGATADKIQIGNGTLGISASMIINANRGMTLTNTGSSIDVFGGQTATYNGIIAGSGTHALTKAGTGTLILGGANTYTGNTTVSNGVIRMTNGSALGTNVGGTTVNSGQVVEFSGAFDTSEPFILNGFGVSGGGALRNITNNTRTLSGQVLLASDARINSDNATLNISNIDLNANTLYVGSSGTVNLSTTLLNGGKTSGDGAIFKDGTGELRLSDAFTALTGNINLVSGTIRINDNAALGNSGTLFMSNGTILRPDNTTSRNTPKSVTLNGNVTLGYTSQGLTLSGNVNLNGGTRTITSIFGNTISGPISNGALTKIGAENLSLSGSNTYAGDTRINAGDLTAASAGAFGGGTDVYIASGATLTVSASTSAASVREAGVSNSGTAILNTGTILTINGANKGTFFQNSISGAGGLTMAGSGTTNMTLFGAQSYTGATAVSGATLTTGVALATGNLTVTGGSFVTTLADALGDNIPVTVNGGTYNMGGSDQVGSVAGTGGTINLNAHTLTTGNNNANTSYSGIIAGSGAITKTGTGTWTLGGQNTYSGLTTVGSGVLSLDGTALANNTIPGNILINGGTLQYGSTADSQIADASNITLSSGAFDAGARTETVASLTMTGGTLTKGGNDLTFNSSSSITGGNVVMTSTGGYTFNSDLTLGNTAINSTATGGSGGTFRIGGTVTVNGGTNPSFTNSGGGTSLRFNLNNAIRTFNIGAGANLTIDWRINSTTAGLGGITKTGAGTMTLTAPDNTLYTNTTTITAGELRLNPSADAAMNSQFVLNGGVLSTANIATGRVFANSSTILLANSSTITLGGNAHELRFANSSGVTWPGSTTITITDWAGTAGNPGTSGRIFVGSTAAHLTEAQMNRITFTGYGPAILLSTGELVPRNPEIFVTVPGGILFPFTTPEGGPSAEQTFTVSGTQLNDDIVLTAPAGYEISLTSGSGFTTTINLSPTSFEVSATTIYVRLAGISAGDANGNVSTTSTDAITQNVPLHGAVLTADAVTISFDTDGLWSTSAPPLSSYSNVHQYNQFQWTFTGGPALRDGTTAQDGFPMGLGTYAWRLQDGGGPDWRATFAQGGTVTSFGFKVRRWDNNPDPNYTVQYSTDGGSTWSAVLATLNNTFLAGGSQWRVFNHILAPVVDIDPGDLVIRVLSSGGERIMIDDFHYDIAVCTNTTWHYRSRVSGNWADFNTWEHSVDGNAPWTIPTCGPTAASASIAIGNGHTVTVNTSITIDQTVIQNSGRILYTGGSINLINGTDDDLVVQNGGVFEFAGGNEPTYENASVRIRVQTGGILRVSSNIGGSSDALAGNGSSNRVIYEHQSIFDWNNTSPFSTSGQIYFPNADQNTIPVFRLSQNVGVNLGGLLPFTINGVFEANGNSTWTTSASKTFRNGIQGVGNVTQVAGGQTFFINGQTAVLGGTGSVLTNSNGLILSSTTVCTLTSTKALNGGPLKIQGTLNAGSFSIIGNHSSLELNSGGRVNTTNPNGFAGTGATFPVTSLFFISSTSIVDYQHIGDQTVTSTTNYGNLIFSGSGNRNIGGNFSIAGNWTIRDNTVCSATAASVVTHELNLTLQDAASFASNCFDNLSIVTNNNFNQVYNATNANPIRLLNFTSNKTTFDRSFQLAAPATTLEVKNALALGFVSLADFRDNGNTIRVGGNATLEGGSTAIYLTGTLEMTGASGNASQLLESTPGDVIGPPLNNFIVNSGASNVVFSPVSGLGNITILGNLSIQSGNLNLQNNLLELRGNWTNYDQSGFTEGSSIIRFAGGNAQSVTCPGGEVMGRIAVSKSAGSFTLNNNLSVSGSGATLGFFTNTVPVNLNGNILSFNGNAGTVTFSGGVVSFTGAAGSEVEINTAAKTFLGVSSGSCLMDNDVLLNLRTGLDCGSIGITVVEGTMQISNNGFIQVNPPLYADNSTLRYGTTGLYNRGNEWNTVSGNIGYPYNVEVFGTNPLNMGTGGTNRPLRGNLTIEQGGALDMQTMSGNLEVLGNVSIGGTTAGTLTLSSVFDGDLLVGGNLTRNATFGNFIQNNREVMMNGVGNVQQLFNVDDFNYLAINNNGGSVLMNTDFTINTRLRLLNGTLNLNGNDVVMANNSLVLRAAAAATMSDEPVTLGTDKYNVEYQNASFTTAFEYSTVAGAVRDVTISGNITTTLEGSRRFDGSLYLLSGNLNLGGHVLTAWGRSADLMVYSGEIHSDGAGARQITGPALSRLDIIGEGGVDAAFRTKQFTSTFGASLDIGPNVEVRMGNGGVNFGPGSPVTIFGVLSVLSGGYAIDNSCRYADNAVYPAGSTLRFANGFDYQVQAGDYTWAAGSIISGLPGIPWNVVVDGTGSRLELFNTRAVRNNLTISNGAEVECIVPDFFGDLNIGGSWSNHNEVGFVEGNTNVVFDGTGTQNITCPGGEVFKSVEFRNSGQKVLNNNIATTDFTIGVGSGTVQAGSHTIIVGEYWLNNQGQNAFNESTSTVIFNGSTAVNTIDANGGEGFYNLIINNTSGVIGLTLLDEIRIGNAMTFTDGIVNTNGHEVVFENGSSYSGAGAQSYVNGVVRKVGFDGTNYFEYPVGYYDATDPMNIVNVYMPAGVRAISSSTSAAYTARYFHENQNPAYSSGNNKPPMSLPLTEVSTCNYWDIVKIPGSPNADVRLYWNEASTCYDVSNPSVLAVAHFNVAQWETVGTPVVNVISANDQGYTQTGPFSTFSPFTIGSSGPGNVLPITLLSFNAEVNSVKLVDATWVTASEVNNDYFTLERSRDGQTWFGVGTVQGAGNSSTTLDYLYTDDAPFSGTSYYRLKQTDFDGAFTYSEVEVVHIDANDGSDYGLHKVFRTESALDFIYTASAPYLTVEIFDISGRLVFGDVLENIEGQNRNSLDVNVARGVYVLRLSDGQREESLQFFY